MKQPSIDSVRLNQRIRELYDIKTENEWPKRLKSSLGENNLWISKSSSEEEKYQSQNNSQELEFNDRTKKLVQHKKSTDSSFEIDWDERLRKFHEKLRFSEDLTIDKKVQARNRTYSDDYDDYSRRQSNTEHFVWEINYLKKKKFLFLIIKLNFFFRIKVLKEIRMRVRVQE